MRFITNFYIQIVALGTLHALAVLLGLGPVGFWPAGFAAALCLLATAVGLTSWKHVIFAWGIFSLTLILIPFFWITQTIHRYTGENYFTTGLLSLGYVGVSQLKFALIFALAYWLGERFLRYPFVAAVCVATAELIVPEIFPWSYGNTIASEPHIRQLASIGSVYLLVFVTVLGGALIYRLLARRRFIRVEILALCLLWSVGGILYYLPTRVPADAGVGVLVVQTSIGAAPEEKREDTAFATEAINRLVNQTLSGLAAHPGIEIVVWPEASMPFHSTLNSGESAAYYSATFDGMIEYFYRTQNVNVLYHDMVAADGRLNSRMAVRGSDATYLKRRLVPWGEYLPFENVLPGLRKIFPNGGRFSSGNAGNEISVIRNNRSLRIKPLICYEALYPQDSRIERADLIINISSDAWFGDGFEGSQHVAAATLRAVENGVPMVRAAMSGVTAIVDSRGDDIVPQSAQATQQDIFARIPLERHATPFQKFGLLPFFILMGLALIPAFYTARNR